MTPNTIEFSTTHNELHNTWVMRITADRRIEVNEDVEVTEAAKKVLEAMQWVLDKQKRPWVELTDHEIEMIYAVTIKIRKKDIMPGEQKMFAKTIQHFLKERNT
jgi:hypothetical protein